MYSERVGADDEDIGALVFVAGTFVATVGTPVLSLVCSNILLEVDRTTLRVPIDAVFPIY